MGDLSDKMSEQDGITSLGSQIYNSPDPQPAAELPWRPLEPGEIIRHGDEYLSGGNEWVRTRTAIGCAKHSEGVPFRTRRPLPCAPPSTEMPVGQISDEELKRATPQCWTEKHTREDGTFDEDKYAEGFNQCVEPAPVQTAREWVDLNDNPETGDLPASKAIELADRADRAEDNARQSLLEIQAIKADALRVEAERDRLREALALEETNAAHWRGKYEALNQTTN